MTTKRERCRVAVEQLLGSPEELEVYLLKHSGLPGRRANLELAAALADLLEQAPPDEELWRRLLAWTADEAPTNSRREYLPFCATQALGACYTGAPDRREQIAARLRAAARDPRWRMREAVCFAFQRIGEAAPDRLLRLFRDWLPEASSMLDRRCMLVALAHPPLLQSDGLVELALELAEQGLRDLVHLDPGALETEDVRVFRKCLEFAPSVYAAADPQRGFERLRAWAGNESPIYKKTVVANLRKARLARHFPDEVEGVVAVLTWSE